MHFQTDRSGLISEAVRKSSLFHLFIIGLPVYGGSTVPCARYATFGTQALSEVALEALSKRCACLLANHGMLVHGRSCAHAFELGLELETLCAQYWRAYPLGAPVLLSAEEMARVLEKFARYSHGIAF